MRMYDRLRAGGGTISTEGDRPALRFLGEVIDPRCPVYEVTNVWQYAAPRVGALRSTMDVDWRRDYFIATPPHGRSWWEWKVRPGEGSPVGTFSPDAVGLAVEVVDLWGPHFSTEPLPDETRRAMHERVAAPGDLAEAEAPLALGEVLFDLVISQVDRHDGIIRDLLRTFGDPFRWFVYVTAAQLEGETIFGPHTVFIFPVAPDGSLLPHVVDYRGSRTAKDGSPAPTRAPLPFICDGRLTSTGIRCSGLPPQPQAGSDIQLIHGQFSNVDDAAGIVHDPGGFEAERATIVRPGDDTYDETYAASAAAYEQAYRVSLERLTSVTLLPFLQAVTFTHLKNARVVTVDPPGKLSRKHQRKRRGLPLVRYQVIEIVPLREALQVRHRTPRSGPGEPVSLHIRPGHFAHYGDCCPGVHEPHGLLFGKWSGRFWVPPHARGNREVGEVLTDYEVREPEAQGGAA